ncbi:hypothetical protein Mkiyose1665_18300 [Mycobacterium kiyosense]|uniref:Uncharacterized protein n=1 Tax=Mycobacterium kiyosense TaxID=2871094 RepID=A0A9P3UTD3_9MYCO|nr:hypothetical protein IWGMT90018_37730 [Mycobacterium kiyosense]BDE13502.1 hypothetical protein MKCMC460_23620 [Mycobacterium sp. 20KCMC460]GLB84160.1 hypothetical protein SRL2020028_34160 [Mycobacterium kiyosense]GLB88435.1 hypothetical protein SRL2020130_12520 [Mycobacterium kiyosense]GLB94640.1 hypothetical protein SRL2020226_14160 [Mycobacterium kiyosense]
MDGGRYATWPPLSTEVAWPSVDEPSDALPHGPDQISDAAAFRTYSLEQVAAMILPAELKDGRRWLADRLNRGEARGYKIGRTWRMTEAHVAELIERCSNTLREPEPAPTRPANSIIDGLSPRARRRVRYQGP